MVVVKKIRRCVERDNAVVDRAGYCFVSDQPDFRGEPLMTVYTSSSDVQVVSSPLSTTTHSSLGACCVGSDYSGSQCLTTCNGRRPNRNKKHVQEGGSSHAMLRGITLHSHWSYRSTGLGFAREPTTPRSGGSQGHRCKQIDFFTGVIIRPG